ncbi:MAG: hypothetical protein ACD_59C00032G0008 [uncultured bacterium]|nr:MAG: hypothetical protein ACD_59C00032G0008 [uncultured bacterium]
MNKIAPIVLFTYNRLWHTQQTINSLLKNDLADRSDVIIFSDGPKDVNSRLKVDEVRKYIKTVNGFKNIEIVESETNKGLAGSIISGVTKIVNEYGRVIVLEDDMITSPYFLRFMNDGLNFYENNEEVISISGYIYPLKQKLPETFFLKGADCWGWATWKRGWDLFEANGQQLLNELEKQNLTYEFDYSGTSPFTKMLKDQIAGKNNSWAIRWYASAFLKQKISLYPGISLIQNIGNDETGVHCRKTSLFDVNLSNKPIKVNDRILKYNDEVVRMMSKFFKVGILKKILDKIKSYTLKSSK